ncbi:MAG: mismatch repair protein MutL [Humisphaera sp.]|nr:mismatch repair protein MutL [Humisphaera sp.]
MPQQTSAQPSAEPPAQSQRRAIQQLSPSLVNRIAAGEVIERPASVVKELVENALDAGASEIIVEVEDGGRELIRVIDNGGGIPVEDLPLAFASHATSKLVTDDDLFQISTKGFRGEALASVGSVSHSKITSRVAEARGDCAYEILNRGGAITDPQAAAGNVGTTVEVRNLFFNVPARRKFLKGTQTEFGHISEMVLRLALPHPDVSFKLLHNNRPVLDLPKTDALDRLHRAWPEEFRGQSLPLEERDAELRLHGVIGLPELARPTAKYQYFYLNGRPIRDRFIQHALREAYRGLTEPGRHPAAILLIDIPPADVDVNVHPTKSEVRFRDSGRIHGLVMAAVREKLLGNDLTPNAVAFGNVAPVEPMRMDLKQKLAEFFKSALPGAAESASPPPQTDDAGGSRGDQWLRMEPGTPQPPMEWPRGETPSHPEEGTVGDSTRFGLHPNPLPAGERGPENIPATPASSSPSPPLPAGPAIQLHNSYLVAQSADGMIIIDQHALHERIMYEELSARILRGPLEAQRLLIPETIPVSSGQMAMLEQIQPLLSRLGIEVSAFGPNTAAVQSFPSFLSKLEPATFVTELLERGEQELLDLHEEELLHEILDMMACKAAVKAGDPLSPAEIEALLARRELVERSSNCPHGRPTTLRLSLRDLEKQFKRTGF